MPKQPLKNWCVKSLPNDTTTPWGKCRGCGYPFLFCNFCACLFGSQKEILSYTRNTYFLLIYALLCRCDVLGSWGGLIVFVAPRVALVSQLEGFPHLSVFDSHSERDLDNRELVPVFVCFLFLWSRLLRIAVWNGSLPLFPHYHSWEWMVPENLGLMGFCLRFPL